MKALRLSDIHLAEVFNLTRHGYRGPEREEQFTSYRQKSKKKRSLTYFYVILLDVFCERREEQLSLLLLCIHS